MKARSARRAALSLSCALLVGACTRDTRPDVLLVVVDTLRADHLGSHGYAKPTSPRLDAFAARATRFARAHSTSSWTAPSVASILTGLYPAEHGVQRSTSVLNPAVPTIAEAFRAAGYATAALTANPVFVSPRMGFDRGFEHFETLHGRKVTAEQPVKMIPLDPTFQSFVEVATADRMTDAALHWIAAQRGARRPWFVLVHYIDPHADYFPPPELAARFGVAPGAPLSGVDQRPVLRSFKAPAGADLETLTALYDAEIAFADEHIGRLLQSVEKEGRPTLVVVTADHGEELGDHGGLLHGQTLFQEQLHVPLLVGVPGESEARVVDTPVSLAGLWATIAALAGIDPAPAGTGASFAGLARGESVPASSVFADLETPSPGMAAVHRRGMIDGDWKMIVRADGGELLFDLARDPRERGGEIAGGGQLGRLRAELARRDLAAEARLAGAAPETIELSPEVRAQMKALGY